MSTAASRPRRSDVRIPSRLDVDPTSQSHKSAGCWSYCRVRRTGCEVEHMHDRAADLLLPGENHELITNCDRFVFHGVSEADVVARDDFHRQLALGVNRDARGERREPDLEHLTSAKRRFGRRVHLARQSPAESPERGPVGLRSVQADYLPVREAVEVPWGRAGAWGAVRRGERVAVNLGGPSELAVKSRDLLECCRV